MVKIRTFYGKIKKIDGKNKFIPEHYALWQTMLNKLKDGQDCTIFFKEIKKARSLKSNSLYWIYLGIIEAETGNEVDDLHRIFKKKFLPWKVKEIFGEKILQLSSTTELSTDEFSEYLRKIERETGILIPDTKNYQIERDSAPMV